MADKLTDFSFDSEDKWFGETPTKDDTTTDQVVKEVKGQTTGKSSNTTKVETASEGVREVKGEDDDEDDVVPNTSKPKTEDSFFGIEEEDDIEDEPKKKEPKKQTKKEAAKKEDEDKDEDEDTDEEEEEVDDVVEAKDKDKKEEDEDDEEDEEATFTALVDDLKARDIFQNVEIKDGEKVNGDKFFELLDEEVEARVNETFETYAENMDEDGKDFIRFKKAGGKTENFLRVISDKVVDFDNFNSDDPKQVKKVLEHYYSKYEEMDKEEVKDKLEWLEEGGKLKADADKKVAKMKKAFEEEKAAVIKAAEDAQKAREENAKKFAEAVTEAVTKTETVGIIPISKTDQKELPSYITKPVVKVGKNSYTPQFMADLNKILSGKTKEDRELLLALAKSVKNKFVVKDVVTETTTKVTKAAKSKVLEAKASGKSKSSSKRSSRNLADYF